MAYCVDLIHIINEAELSQRMAKNTKQKLGLCSGLDLWEIYQLSGGSNSVSVPRSAKVGLLVTF